MDASIQVVGRGLGASTPRCGAGRLQGNDGTWVCQAKSIPLETIEVSVDRDATEERAGTYRLSVVSVRLWER